MILNPCRLLSALLVRSTATRTTISSSSIAKAQCAAIVGIQSSSNNAPCVLRKITRTSWTCTTTTTSTASVTATRSTMMIARLCCSASSASTGSTSHMPVFLKTNMPLWSIRRKEKRRKIQARVAAWLPPSTSVLKEQFTSARNVSTRNARSLHLI